MVPFIFALLTYKTENIHDINGSKTQNDSLCARIQYMFTTKILKNMLEKFKTIILSRTILECEIANVTLCLSIVTTLFLLI